MDLWSETQEKNNDTRTTKLNEGMYVICGDEKGKYEKKIGCEKKRKEKKIQISVVENYEFSVFVHKMFQILFNRLMKTHDP